MTATSSQLYSLKRGDGATPTEAFAKVKGVTTINIGNGSAAVLDATDLESTAKQKQMGLPDEGKCSISGNYFPGNATLVGLQADRTARTLRNFKLCDPTGTTVGAFAGYVLSFELDFGPDKLSTYKADIEIDGAVTWTL